MLLILKKHRIYLCLSTYRKEMHRSITLTARYWGPCATRLLAEETLSLLRSLSLFKQTKKHLAGKYVPNLRYLVCNISHSDQKNGTGLKLFLWLQKKENKIQA